MTKRSADQFRVPMFDTHRTEVTEAQWVDHFRSMPVKRFADSVWDIESFKHNDKLGYCPPAYKLARLQVRDEKLEEINERFHDNKSVKNSPALIPETEYDIETIDTGKGGKQIFFRERATQ